MYRHNPDERLRQLERYYHSDPTPQTLSQLNTEKFRSGIAPELGIDHLRYLAEGIGDLIGAESNKWRDEDATWDGTYQGIDIHINARRLYGAAERDHPEPRRSTRFAFLQIGRRLAYFEIPLHPMIELYADSEPMNINFGKGNDYFQLSPHQPWIYDPQLLLDYLMELNQRMEEGDWYQDWMDANSYWLRELRTNPKKIRKMVRTKKRRPAQVIKHFDRQPTGRPQYTNEELLQLKEEYYRQGQHLLYPEFDFGCKECGSEGKHRYFCSKD
jgi:hypothetical protein